MADAAEVGESADDVEKEVALGVRGGGRGGREGDVTPVGGLRVPTAACTFVFAMPTTAPACCDACCDASPASSVWRMRFDGIVFEREHFGDGVPYGVP